MKITAHFTWEEFTHSQTAARHNIRNTPVGGSQVSAILRRTAATLEKVRTILGDKSVLVSSGYRCSQLNAMIGGARDSAHTHGLAVDFTCPDFGTPIEICKKLKPHMKELNIDQLIHEYDTWVHLGLRDGAPPRHAAMTIDKTGTHYGIV